MLEARERGSGCRPPKHARLRKPLLSGIFPVCDLRRNIAAHRDRTQPLTNLYSQCVLSPSLSSSPLANRTRSFHTANLGYAPPSLLLLNPDPISPNGARKDVTPFCRGTVVFNATLAPADIIVNEATLPPLPPKPSYVVKFSHVQDTRAYREALALDLVRHARVPNTPELVFAFSTRRLDSQIALPLPPNIGAQIVPRHVTIIVTRFEAPCTHLIHAPLSFQEMARAFVDVLLVLKASVAAGIIHRDVSAGNLLFCLWRVVFNDWDCCKIVAESRLAETEGSDQGRTGTLDMAAIAVLRLGAKEGFQHLPHHDLESVVYFLWYFLSLRLPGLLPSRVDLLFGVQTSKEAILVARMELWGARKSDAKQRAVQNLARNGMISVIEVITALAELQEKIVVEAPNIMTDAEVRWDRDLKRMVPCKSEISDYDETVDAMIAIFRGAAGSEPLEAEKAGMRNFWRNPS